MTLISSPVFVCFVVALALLLGFLVGGRWQRKVYDAIWRDGANATIAYICANYDRVPRKLSKLLTIATLELQASGKLEIERESDDSSRAERAEADTPTDN